LQVSPHRTLPSAAATVPVANDVDTELPDQLQALQRWEQDGVPAEREQRRLVAQKFKTFLENPTATRLALLDNTDTLTSLPPLPAKLTAFMVVDGTSLIESPPLAHCTELQKLGISNCRALTTLDLSQLKKLQTLSLSRWQCATEPPDLSACTQLTGLDMTGWRSLINPPDLSSNTKLYDLSVSLCDTLTTPPNLSACEDLYCVNLIGCRHLNALPDFSNNAKLVIMHAKYCSTVIQPPDVTHCPQLATLSLENCSSIVSAPDLSQSVHLYAFDMTGCRLLTAAPDWRNCRALAHIQLRDCNGISNLPSVASLAALRILDVRGCPLTSLPEDIQHLHPHCLVDIDAANFSHAVRSRLQTSMNVPGYRGPQISFSMADGAPVVAAVLPDEVNGWRREIAGKATPSRAAAATAAATATAEPTAAIDWNVFIAEPHADDFARFLARIRETSDYLQQTVPAGATRSRQQQMQQRVHDLISQMETDAELRATCFNLASDAVNTCGDRVALGLTNMEMLCLDQKIQTDIANGKFDSTPGALFALCKGQHRLQILFELAAEKIKTLNFCDEIEVLVGFIVAFASSHNLPVQMDSILYPRCTSLTSTDLTLAEQRLSNRGGSDHEQQQNQHAYAQSLTSSPHMIALLSRKYPVLMAAASESIKTGLAQANEDRYAALNSLDAEAPDHLDQANRVSRDYASTCTRIRHEAIQPLLQQLAITHAINLDLSATTLHP
jgi:hypothetical protein